LEPEESWLLARCRARIGVEVLRNIYLDHSQNEWLDFEKTMERLVHSGLLLVRSNEALSIVSEPEIAETVTVFPGGQLTALIPQ
jgi:hypothetical protein